ncbi:MAG TPA: SDR family NAD(P)-dependent oxidoreductase, partial [Chloroflexota bacterium]|nr:SDR family NAD(P)-dependent oxidoreductase [Chloroflexota bacterium]
MGKLSGKVALVTGSARGLGRAYALHLAQLGADIVVNDIDMDAAKAYDEKLTAPTVMDEVRAIGSRSLGIVADVTDQAQVRSMLAQIISELGQIDILVNNAGGALVPGPSYASSVPEADFRRMLDINLMGTVFCCQAVAEPMKSQGRGKIVNVGSQAGLRSQGGGGGTSYSVAKAAIHHYTRKLADELGPFGINVNCIAPGYILSSRAIAGGRNRPESRARLEGEIALRRLGMPIDCAKVVEFLVTDLSDYVTGQIIP